ncbi:predicted protein [Streptomyces sp. C]|nr:predicted protein [Streptomyces sp. C]
MHRPLGSASGRRPERRPPPLRRRRIRLATLPLMLTDFQAQWRLRPAGDRPVRSRVGMVERPDRLLMVPTRR